MKFSEYYSLVEVVSKDKFLYRGDPYDYGDKFSNSLKLLKTGGENAKNQAGYFFFSNNKTVALKYMRGDSKKYSGEYGKYTLTTVSPKRGLKYLILRDDGHNTRYDSFVESVSKLVGGSDFITKYFSDKFNLYALQAITDNEVGVEFMKIMKLNNIDVLVFKEHEHYTYAFTDSSQFRVVSREHFNQFEDATPESFLRVKQMLIDKAKEFGISASVDENASDGSNLVINLSMKFVKTNSRTTKPIPAGQVFTSVSISDVPLSKNTINRYGVSILSSRSREKEVLEYLNHFMKWVDEHKSSIGKGWDVLHI
jgi:hypothetical protein